MYASGEIPVEAAVEVEAPEGAVGRRAARSIVLACFGSLGDLHPYLAIALELHDRGHRVTLATCPEYRAKVEGEGLAFHPIRPSMGSEQELKEKVSRVMSARDGSRYLMQELMMPALRDQFQDLQEACRGADLLVGHILTFPVRMIAEREGIPWVSTVLQPLVFCSEWEPPVPPQWPAFRHVYRFGRGVNRAVIRAAKRSVRPFAEPVNDLRRELGLEPLKNPLFEGSLSPLLNLALFSSVLGSPRPDWPSNTVVTGFPFFDRLEAGTGMPPGLARFLEEGDPPVVFTLGSAAVVCGDGFFAESYRAALALGRRAVFVGGADARAELPERLPAGMHWCDYAPYGELFPRAAAVVHQGGVGTTGQSLRAGRPVLVVPFAHDQPDNAVRLERLGMARWIERSRYRADRALRELRRILEHPSFALQAEAAAARVRTENGAAAAADALEALKLPSASSVESAAGGPAR